MDFIDEENYFAVCLRNFLQNGLQSLFEFTSVFRTSNKRTYRLVSKESANSPSTHI